jgi:FkbM family methyltransferase
MSTEALWTSLGYLHRRIGPLIPRPTRKLIRSNVRKALIWHLFGSTGDRQEAVRFRHGGRLYVSSSDNRGKRLVRQHGVTQPLVTWSWRQLREILQPDLLYDVGANYGEISLGGTYRANEMLLLLEPNPNVLHCLQRSLDDHPSRHRMKIIDRAVFDRGGRLDFVVDEKWSGTSSAMAPVVDDIFKGPGQQTCTVLSVACITLDELTACYASRATSLLIKIDIEGAEVPALKGAQRALMSVRKFAILIEYNRKTLRQDAPHGEHLWEIIRSLGHVYSVRAGEYPHRVGSEVELGEKVDLIVVPPGEVAERFARLRVPYALRWCA